MNADCPMLIWPAKPEVSCSPTTATRVMPITLAIPMALPDPRSGRRRSPARRAANQIHCPGVRISARS